MRDLGALILLLSSQAVAAPPPLPSDFHSFDVRGRAGAISYHLDKIAQEKPGPLIIWLPGSGAMPFFQTFDDGSKGYMFPLALLARAPEAHFLLVDKPGVPFTARIAFNEEEGRPKELDNAAYRAGLTKENLVERASEAIRDAKRRLGARATSLIITGGSEGAQYAFAVANEVGADQVIVWGGNALPQYFDFIIEQRNAAETGKISREQAQKNVEDILLSVQRIRAAPNDVHGRFMGEAYKRWSGFGPYAPVEDMLHFRKPILFMQGGADSNAPILNSDFAALAFAMEGRTNLTYKVYPNLDHHFRTPDGTSQADQIWDAAWQWMSTNLASVRGHP